MDDEGEISSGNYDTISDVSVLQPGVSFINAKHDH